MKKEELRNTRQFKELLRRSEQKRKDGADAAYAYINNVPLTWCVRFDLSTLDLVTYCYIRDCTKNFIENAYTGSIKGLCAKFNTSLPTMRKTLAKLEAKGFIFKRKAPYGAAQWVRYMDALIKKPDDHRTLEEILAANVTIYELRQNREKKQQTSKEYYG